MKGLRPVVLAACARLLMAALPLVHSACTGYAEISEREPELLPLKSSATLVVEAERKIAVALKSQSKDPSAALGDLLVAARQIAPDPPIDGGARQQPNRRLHQAAGK